MIINRVEFIACSVLGPRQRSFQVYKPGGDWKGWKVSSEGGSVVFEGEGRRIEVPRARCIVHYDVPMLEGEAPATPPPTPKLPGARK